VLVETSPEEIFNSYFPVARQNFLLAPLQGILQANCLLRNLSNVKDAPFTVHSPGPTIRLKS
jgi:hypothetical protein